jgi:hypothetical protein
MSELNKKLTQLSERGTALGSSTLRERVAVDLAHGSSPSIRMLPGWAVALVVAVVALIAIGGTSILLGGSEGSLEPDAPFDTPPTTEAYQPLQLESEALPVFPLSEVPAFVGLLESGTGSGTAQMSIEYGGSGTGLRVELMTNPSSLLEPIPFGELVEGGQGSFLVFDGDNDGEIHLLRDGIVEGWHPAGAPLYRLDWRDESFGLGQVCERTSHVAKPLDEVAGRAVHVIECVGMGQDFTASVDAQTGLVLQVVAGDEVVASLVGSFKFRTIQYPGSLDDSAFDVASRDESTASDSTGSCDPNCPAEEEDTEEYMRAMLNDMDNDVGLTGNPAPSLRGRLLDGSPFSLEDMDGQAVLLHFWFPSFQILEYANREGDWNFARESFEAETWAAETWDTQVVIVSVAPGDLDLVEAIIQDPDPNVRVLIPDEYHIDPGCDCPEVWDFPFQPGNTWVLVGTDGVVAGSFYQWYPTIAALKVLMESLSNEVP